MNTMIFLVDGTVEQGESKGAMGTLNMIWLNTKLILLIFGFSNRNNIFRLFPIISATQ